MKYPNYCVNPKCGEDLRPLKLNSIDETRRWDPGIATERTGRFLCPSCRYFGKWAFAIGAGAVGLVGASLSWR